MLLTARSYGARGILLLQPNLKLRVGSTVVVADFGEPASRTAGTSPSRLPVCVARPREEAAS
jgi:hypothetical protein